MENPETIKEIVREKYGRLARENESCCGPTSCCGPAAEGESPFVDFSDDHARLEGYVRDADLGLGCGLPTEGADLKPGQIVLDLGSGAGNDVFVARRAVGEAGSVDRVLSNCVLNLVPDKTRAFAEMHRVLKPGGGFTDVAIAREKAINLPGDLLSAYLGDAGREALKNSGVRILSVTVRGAKTDGSASASASPCCTPLETAEPGDCCAPVA